MMHKSQLLVSTLSLLVVLCSHSTLSEVQLPSAIVSPDETEVVTFRVDAEGNLTSLLLNCSGVGELTWYRGNPPYKLGGGNVTLAENNNLMLNITPVVNNTDASGDGIPYFCVANNSLGMARSRTVLVRYASFGGFEAMNTTTEIVIRIGEAVAISCGVVSAVPPPDYIWFRNNETIDTEANTNKIRTLDDGATLVIYDLNNDDVSFDYKCGVTNARMFDTEISTRLFMLSINASFSETFFSYRDPKSVTVTSTALKSGITFFYIVANNDPDTIRLFGANDFAVTVATLSAEISTEPTEQLFLGLRGQGAATIPGSVVNIELTVIEPLMVLERPSNNSNVFSFFTNESVNFTCDATGTGAQLQWYHNAEKIQVNSTTLVFDRLSVNNSGVYQCFWEESDDGTFALDTWALVVQEPVPPRSFVITSSGETPTTNRTIVPSGTLVSLTMTFVADEVRSITWFRTDAETNNVTQIQFNGSTLYNTTGFVETAMENVFMVVFTVIEVNNVTSGYYHAVIDDGRTPPIAAPTWFIFEQVLLEVTSLTLSPVNCLLRGVANQIQCLIRGLPDPMTRFERSTNEVECPANSTCEITTSVFGLVTTANLTFFDVSAADEGVYVCEGSNSVANTIPDTVEGTLLVEYSTANTLEYCESPVIAERTDDMSVTEGASVTLQCTVSTVPLTDIVAKWYKNGEMFNTDDSDHVGVTPINSQGVLGLTFDGVFENDTANYTCFFNNTFIPEHVMATISLTVVLEEVTSEPSSLPAYIPIVAGVGGALFLFLIVGLIIVLCMCGCLVKSNKQKKGSFSPGIGLQDYTDGRGNVDKDSDEEDDKEQPEAFQPQYESLPAIRPAVPPEYKPSPAYNNIQFGTQEDFDSIMKPPIPDDNQTPSYPTGTGAGGYHPQQFFQGDNGGMVIHGSMMQGLQSQPPMGSSMGLHHGQARYDDFMSDDEKFV